METIKKISSTGFLTENGWRTCDKFKVLIKPLFLDLKVGDTIDSIKTKTDKEGKVYVIDFIVLSHKDSVSEEEVCPPNDVSSVSSSSPIHKDRIMYGQCVNIAFNSFGTFNLFHDGTLKQGFDLADLLYEEYSRRVK